MIQTLSYFGKGNEIWEIFLTKNNYFRNKSKTPIMALMFKQSRLNMRGIKRSTKLLINSKAMWKNAERPRFDSTVKSSKFMVNY